jgi:hypothetical protein
VRFIPCRACGSACSSPEIANGVCNFKLKCIARKPMPPNCGTQQTSGSQQMLFQRTPELNQFQRTPLLTQQVLPLRTPQFTSGQGQLSSSTMSTNQGQMTSAFMGGQFDSFGQSGMTSMNGQLALANRAFSAFGCPTLNCPMLPTCSFPSVLQTPMIGGCPSCPRCTIPGGCTDNSQCSAGMYCLLGRCLPFAQEGDVCLRTLCQPPLVCTVMGTCIMPSCSCGVIPCPLDQQFTPEIDDSLVTGGCPPCPRCRA